jgi:hypothetical protein
MVTNRNHSNPWLFQELNVSFRNIRNDIILFFVISICSNLF